MTDEDVRDMLRERAASITPSPDGLERIQAKLDGAVVAPAEVARRRRFPVLASAAAVAVVAVIGTVVVAQRDDATNVESGPLATSPTTAAAPASSVPHGVWPWPGDAVDEEMQRTDPLELAYTYVESRLPQHEEIQVSGFEPDGRTSGDVVFSGDWSTTVHLRQVDGRWFVESASSDLVTLHDAGDGAVTARVETGGELTRTTATSGTTNPMTETVTVQGGEEYAGLGYTLGRDDVVLRELFVLDTVDGTIGLTELSFRAGTAPATPDATATASGRQGVWPWPGDIAPNEDVWLIDPRETAMRYVSFRLGGDLGDTTVSELQQGDGNSGEIVFTGDVSTTVAVRQLDGVWHVEAAYTDLLSLLVEDDEVAWTVPGGGELTGNAEGESVPADQRGPVRYEAGNGASIELTEATGIVRHWFTLVTDDGTIGLAEVRVDHGGGLASEDDIPEDALSQEGGLDAKAVAIAYLADRLGGRPVEVGERQGSEDGYGEVPWEAGVVILQQSSGGVWYVVQAVGDSVQIESATFDDDGTLRGELRLAQAGVATITFGGRSVEVRNDADREGTIVPFEVEPAGTTSAPLRVVFETDTGFVSLAERVVTA